MRGSESPDTESDPPSPPFSLVYRSNAQVIHGSNEYSKDVLLVRLESPTASSKRNLCHPANSDGDASHDQSFSRTASTTP